MGRLGRLGDLSQWRRAGLRLEREQRLRARDHIRDRAGGRRRDHRPISALLWLCRFADDVQDFEEFMAHAV